MPEFEMIKGFDEIQDRVLLEPGTYHATLCKDPVQEPSKDGTGTNLVLHFETFGDKKPEFNGQVLTIWLSMPKPQDADTFRYGRSMADSKMERIMNVAKALGGKVEGATVSFPKVGKRCRIQITKDTYVDPAGETQLRNSISQLLPEK